jgi:lipopolysaccharide biosynthesis glycosyltransferase
MQEKMTRIPVALATDKNNVLPLSVTVASLLVNAAENTFYDVHIYTQNKLSGTIADALLSFESVYPNSKINLHVIAAEAFLGAVFSQRFGIANFYRLLLPEFLPTLDKCIYLDTDIIVMGDLTDLYNLEMGGNYVAGVRIAGWVTDRSTARQRAKEMGIPNVDHYINNGVMLMNLAEMRANNVPKQAVKLTRKKYTGPCQDITNATCFGHIRLIPFKYNIIAKYWRSDEQLFFKQPGMDAVYTRQEYRDALLSPVAYHLISKNGKGKPWSAAGLELSELWWQYARLSVLWPDIKQAYGKFQPLVIQAER